MWDDDDFEIADPNAAPGEGYVAAIIFGIVLLAGVMLLKYWGV